MRASEKDGRGLERERRWGTAGKGRGGWGKKTGKWDSFFKGREGRKQEK